MEDSSQDSTRLNKYLALQLGISRREADMLIEDGKVTVNGAAASLGGRYRPDDAVEVSGKPLAGSAKLVYIAFHKPVGYVCSRKQQGDIPTIFSLLPEMYHYLKPVGRLDKDSSGLILLSNDGDFTFRMTHPKFIKPKQYEAHLDKDLEPLHQQMISDYGVQLEDGRSQLQLERMDDNGRRDWKVIMREGRNRQIRRTFASLGYTVLRLHRTHFGNYALGDIKPGEFEIVDIQ